MEKEYTSNRLHGVSPNPSYARQEVTKRPVTAKQAAKPARITKRQLAPVLALVRRVAAGGDATTGLDAAACIPMLEAALAVAPAGQRTARLAYECRLPDGTVQRVEGLRAVAGLAGKALSTVANAIGKGGGKAEFPCHDALGNPARIYIRRLA